MTLTTQVAIVSHVKNQLYNNSSKSCPKITNTIIIQNQQNMKDIMMTDKEKNNGCNWGVQG